MRKTTASIRDRNGGNVVSFSGRGRRAALPFAALLAVLFAATALAAPPPETTIDSGPSGLTNDSTPTFTFSSNVPGSFECKIDAGAFAACTSPHTTAVLSDGAHTFQVRAISLEPKTDPTPASQSFSVDTNPPQTTINSGPSGLTNDNTPSFSFSSTEPGSSFECSVDAGAFAACTSPHTTTALSDGAHSFEVRAIDPATNPDPTPASQNFTVDATAPQTTIDSGPTDPTADNTPTFSFSSNEPGSFECKVDAGAFAACTSPHTTAPLSDGAHTFEVRAIDSATNPDPTPASQGFSVDATAPQTTIDSGPTDPTNDNTPTFSFSSTEPGSSFECSVDAGAFAACTSSHTTAALSDGAHSFEVRATDALGNPDPTPASQNFSVDTNPPNTTIDSGPTDPTADNTPTFSFSSNEPGSFECKVDAGAFAACTSPHTTAPLSDGAHTFEVRAIDSATNPDPTPASQGFSVDTNPPQTTIDSGPTDPTNDNTPTFSFSSTEPGSSFECSVDAGAFAACTSSHTTAALSDGAHSFEVRATDALGNPDPTPASQNFSVDTNPPNTTIDSGPTDPTADNTPTFSFSSNEPGSFECKVDAGAFAACTSPHTTAPLSDGAHTFEVRAIDSATNPDPTPASQGFSVDATAPQTTIDSGPTDPTNDNTPTFSFSSTEPGSSFECSVDAGAFAACTSSHTTAALSDGAHSFEVRATDALGNPDPTPASQNFSVDTNPPNTTIDSGPTDPTADNTPTFSFSSNEPGSFECKVDAGAFAACTSPHTTAPLDDGAHSFEVRATDALGHLDASPATQNFTIASSSPPGPDTDVTNPILNAKKTAKHKRAVIQVKLSAGAGEAVSVSAAGKVRAAGVKGAKFKPVSAEVGAGELVKLKLKVGGAKAAPIIDAIEDGAKATAKVKVTYTDAAGNSALLKAKVKVV